MSQADKSDDFSALFSPEPARSEVTDADNVAIWKILLVDDETGIHALFRLALQGLEVEGRTVQLFDASSAEEAKGLLSEHPDMALVLLDVVMETEQAGLTLVWFIRQALNNRLVQIVLITGQPGYAPQRRVVIEYEINGYRLKSELTADKIFVSVYVAIRAHHALLKISRQQQLLDEAERRAQEDRMLKAFIVESSEDAIIGKTLDGIVTSWTRAAEKIFGYTAEEMIGHSLSTIIPVDRRDEDRKVMVSIMRGEVINLFETERIRKDGSRINVFLTISPIRNLESFTVGISEIARNITERKQAEVKLQLAANVFTHAREAIMITDLVGSIIDVNDTFTRMTGYSRDEILGKNPRLLKSGHQSKSFYKAMWNDLIEEGYWSGELWNRRKNGEIYVEMKTISTVRDALGKAQHYVSLSSDITLLKEHEKQLEHLAHYDVLTSLPNRVLLADRLHQCMASVQRRALRLGVVFLDLDGFKEVNDNHGHDIGDRLLMSLASRMKQTLRDADTLSRLGGDEFVAVLPDLTSIEDCLPMVNRLLSVIAEPVTINNISLKVSASLGVTFYPQSQDVDADQLLRQADQAMYQAKVAGKNRYHVFDAEQDSSIRVYHESLDRIRQALVMNEFVLYYQPKVNMRSGTVLGVEALIRWQNPEQGLLSPTQFLPLIENHALAVEIGEWVIETALTQISSWRAAGLAIPVSVNVGARQFQQIDFIERLHNLMAGHPSIQSGDLELEVLETSAMENLYQISQVIRACEANGVSVALDDFGTGYSSLTYLKRLPVTTLKIDQSFVRDMLFDPDNLTILDGVLGLAAAFHRKVIAEGVEGVEHGELLLQIGCELAQGYVIARPMPANEIPGWLATWQPAKSWRMQSLISRNNLPLLYASVECRAWLLSIENLLKDEQDVSPPINNHESNFRTWLSSDGLAAHIKQSLAQTVNPLYKKIQTSVAELFDFHTQGRMTEALASMNEIRQLRNKLLLQLKALAEDTAV